MKSILLVLSTLISSSAFATVTKIECKRDRDTLSIIVGKHLGDGPTFYGFQLNDSPDNSGHEVFNSMLADSRACEDLASYARVERSEVLLCAGEVFVPNGVYGQVILSKGAIGVFKNVIAPASGWKCN